MYQAKNGSTERSKVNKTVPENVATTCTEDGHRLPKQAQYKPKVATTCTEDGHKQTTKTSTTI